MKRFVSAMLSCTLLLLTGCQGNADPAQGKEVTLVLDYVPNTNHTGFYVAQEKGYYEEEGLQVNIIEPGDNNTSLALVATDKGQFGVSYQEDVTYALTAQEPMPIKAIATIIQHNTSGFVHLQDTKLDSPKDFEGKTYAGWQALSEEAVLKALMKKADADFSQLTMVGSDGSGLTQLQNGIDFMWEFKGWAVKRAEMDGMDLNFIPLQEFDERLDYYTPLIVTNETMLKEDPETVQKFINATKKGYEYAIENPKEAAAILHKIIPDTDLEFLEESQAYLSQEYAKDAQSWGIMKDSVWDGYTQFMQENGLIETTIPADQQYTNEFVEVK